MAVLADVGPVIRIITTPSRIHREESATLL